MAHYWDAWNGSAYTSEAILGNGCDYELTGLNRGLKTASKTYTRQSPGSSNWTLARTDSYSYDANLDYLVGATYGDSLPGNNVTWTYDAAGNRASDSSQSGTWTYDNLNRMTASPGKTYANDILGNRSYRYAGAVDQTYTWDVLNRMVKFQLGSSQECAYTYRADGLRVKKVTGSGTTLYRYDGQMGMQDVELDSSNAVVSVTDSALGARGVDALSKTTSSGTVVSYPLYDAHGNMVSTLAKSGSGYSYSAVRTFDAWGSVRSGGSTGDPAGKHCANLGHKQDDESGLIYMRARYYEPGTGRFISEDPAFQGSNWFQYCRNDGVNNVDETGRWERSSKIQQGILTVGFAAACMLAIEFERKGNLVAAIGFILIACGIAETILGGETELSQEWKDTFVACKFLATITGACATAGLISNDVRLKFATAFAVAYTTLICAAIVDTMVF